MNPWRPDNTSKENIKWNHGGKADLQMWVADMDFPVACEIREALAERVGRWDFGYGLPPKELSELAAEHIRKRHGWKVESDWITWFPEVLTGVRVFLRMFTNPGDGVINMSPLYPPLFNLPEYEGRRVLDAPLRVCDGKDCIDLERVESHCREGAKLLLLCNPHNPTGRAFTAEELRPLTEICNKYGTKICSDDIHADLMLANRRHVPVASLDNADPDGVITLMAPSKTFNITGLGLGFSVISSPKLRGRFRQEMLKLYPHVSVVSYSAGIAAYSRGEHWLEETLAQLKKNHDKLFEFVRSCRGLFMREVEATYLAWLNVSELGVEFPHKLFLHHGINFSDGVPFGSKDHIRINFACPTKTLDEALRRMETALRSLQ